MATAVKAPAPLVLISGPSFSTGLSAASLDVISARPLDLVGMNAGTRLALADPRPAAFQVDGGIAPVHGLAVLGRIHVFPRRHDLGAVVSEQEAEVEVWNADIQRGHTLQEITVDGPAGIAVEDDVGQPAHFPASASHLYLVKVLSERDDLIDNLVTW